MGDKREFDLTRLHPSDRFAAAGEPVPDDLAPLDVGAGIPVYRIVREFLERPPDEQAAFRARLAGLPQQKRTAPARMPTAHHFYATSPESGAVVMRLLGNRNLSWAGIAHLDLMLSGRYWSAATYGGVGLGRKALTPEMLGDFGMMLNIPAEDLAELTGITPVLHRPDPGVASLIWDLRRLTSEQVHELFEALGDRPGR
jgi:hypothetical protein